MENYQHQLLIWILCSGVGGAGAAMALYYGTRRWKRPYVWILATLRTLSFATVLFLLIAPRFDQSDWREERPLFLVAWDNSESMRCCVDSLALRRSLRSLRVGLEEWGETKGVSLKWYYLDQEQGMKNQGLRLSAHRSNIGGLIGDLGTRHASDHVLGMLLLSDGLHNQGPALSQASVSYPMHVVGVGDTVSRRDLAIEELLYNKISYQGTRMTIEVLLSQKGYSGESIEVSLEGQGTKQRQVVGLSGAALEVVRFTLSTPQEGNYRYKVRVRPLSRELTTENNQKSVFIKVLKEKLRVLILAPYAHPDLGALRLALSSLPYYDTDLVIHAAGDLLDPKVEYDLAILYDVFAEDQLFRSYESLWEQGVPMWWFVTPRSRVDRITKWPEAFALGIHAKPAAVEAAPLLHRQGLPFETHLPFAERISVYPPVALPSFQMSGASGSVSLLDQALSRPQSPPLWWISKLQKRRIAISLGSGYWQWRLQESALYEESLLFDELVLGMVKYLGSKSDQKKFKVYPLRELFFTDERPVFRSEVYDRGLVPRYGDLIRLEIHDLSTNWTQTYTYTHQESSKLFRMPPLPAATYSYEARLEEKGTALRSRGRFYVEENTAEGAQLRADFPLLRRLSSDHGGHFYTLSQRDRLFADLDALSTSPRHYAVTRSLRLIAWEWILFALLAILLSEWAVRKYRGVL